MVKVATPSDFIQAYLELEEDIRMYFNLTKEDSIVRTIRESPQYAIYTDKMQSCANLRNYYQHTARVKNIYAANPVDEAVEFLKFLREKVQHRKKCREICVPFRKVNWRTENDYVREAITAMREQAFTYIPILDNGVVTGIFDENSLFNYVSDNHDEIFILQNNLCFGDIRSYLALDNRELEEFAFFGMNRYADDAAKLFVRPSNGKRLEMIFLTNTGKKTEKLQGILTPWDVISIE